MLPQSKRNFYVPQRKVLRKRNSPRAFNVATG